MASTFFPEMTSTKSIGDDVNLVVNRVHTAASLSTKSEEAKAIEDLHKLINSINANVARNTQRGLIFSKSKLTRGDAQKMLLKRNGNKEEKDKMVAAITSYKDAHIDQSERILLILAEFGKPLSLNLEKNIQLLQNAITKAHEKKLEPVVFAQKVARFIDQYQAVLVPLMDYCSTRADMRFFTWGAIMEAYKTELRSLIVEALKSWESTRFLFSKCAFYGMGIVETSFMVHRIIMCTFKVCMAAVNEGLPTEIFKKGGIVNEDVYPILKKVLANKVFNFDREKAIENLKLHFIEKLSSLDLQSSLIASVGIPPYAVFQCSEYKQNSMTNNDKRKDAIAHCASAFGLIRNCHNALTKTEYKYKNSVFGQLKSEVWDLWQPMFVVARNMRAIIDPTQGFITQNEIEFNVDMVNNLQFDVNDDTPIPKV